MCVPVRAVPAMCAKEGSPWRRLDRVVFSVVTRHLLL